MTMSDRDFPCCDHREQATAPTAGRDELARLMLGRTAPAAADAILAAGYTTRTAVIADLLEAARAEFRDAHPLEHDGALKTAKGGAVGFLARKLREAQNA
jgi:hypothetical protein